MVNDNINKFTMEEIANKLNISRTTVWRVVNQKKGVSPTTEKKVKGMLEAYSYSKNLIASSLRKKTTKTIGVIFADIENPFYAAALNGIEEVCLQNKYNLMFSLNHENYHLERQVIEFLCEKRIDGLILVPVEGSEHNLDLIEKLGLQTVFLARYIKKYGGNRVTLDDFHAGYIATSFLLDKGHKIIAHLAGPLGTSSTYDRLEGYKKALEDRGVEFDLSLVIYGNSMKIHGRINTFNLFKDRKDITAIFSYSDFVAYGVLEALESLGLKIPENVAVIGCDDNELSSSMGLTTISSPKEDMGKLAAKILIKKLTNIDKDLESIDVRICKPKLEIRKTV